MSEAVEGAVTAGRLLREARQAAGMHIGALAVALKVPVAKLEALETDNHAVLTDTVFVRALASSVCRTLKVDPAPILSLLPQSQSPRLSTDSAGLNAPVKTHSSKLSSASASYSSGSASKSVTFVVLALLVGAVGVFFYPRQQGGDSVATSEPVAATPTILGTAPAGASATAPVVEQAPAMPESLPASAPESAVAQAPVPAAVSSDPITAAAAAPSGTLVLRARSESWVQVRDAAGAVVLQRNLAAQESVSVNAPGPLAVVVGRADATEVFVHGKPFDLAGVSRENVARFEVK